MVRAVRARQFYDDEDWDDFDPKYPGKRVFKDGRGPRVPLYMTDSAPPRRYSMTDAVRRHQATIDSYRLTDREAAAHRPHEATASLSDAEIMAARSRSEHARAEWIRRMQDAWSSQGPIGGLPRTPPDGNGPDDDDDNGHDDSDPRSASERARDAWIERQSNAWRDPVGRGAWAGPNPSHGYSGPSSYAQGVWSAQNAIRPGSPYAAEQVEAARRKTTRESTTDAGDDRARAYAEYCRRISVDWMR
jgi:hypothetical protein